MDWFPVYSPDGEKIAFCSDRTGHFEIYTCNSDGSESYQITSLNTHSGVPRWSPSGEHIIFDSRPDGNSDIMIVDAEGKKRPEHLTKHPSDDRIPSWSADGQFIYFGSNRSGEYQIYKMSVNSKEVEQITSNGGVFGYESADGKNFYFRKYNETYGPIYQINLKNKQESVVIDEQIYSFSWVLKQAGIYFISSHEKDQPVLKFYRFFSDSIDQLGFFDDVVKLSDVSDVGKNILLWSDVKSSFDIYLVDNFRL